jgi:thioredoxin 1
MKKIILAVSTLIFISSFLFCSKSEQDKSAVEHKTNTDNSTAKITFVELGSVDCIPCKAMKPVMEAIENKYGDQIAVIFYDIKQSDQKQYAQQYGIKLIPTQVFLDENSNEVMRHEGFFAEEAIDTFLQSQGLKILETDKIEL